MEALSVDVSSHGNTKQAPSLHYQVFGDSKELKGTFKVLFS
jgi:hypothetical protein